MPGMFYWSLHGWEVAYVLRYAYFIKEISVINMELHVVINIAYTIEISDMIRHRRCMDCLYFQCTLQRIEWPLIARFMGPIWGQSGAARTQVGPMLARWTLLSGTKCIHQEICLLAIYRALVSPFISFKIPNSGPSAWLICSANNRWTHIYKGCSQEFFSLRCLIY